MSFYICKISQRSWAAKIIFFLASTKRKFEMSVTNVWPKPCRLMLRFHVTPNVRADKSIKWTFVVHAIKLVTPT